MVHACMVGVGVGDVVDARNQRTHLAAHVQANGGKRHGSVGGAVVRALEADHIRATRVGAGIFHDSVVGVGAGIAEDHFLRRVAGGDFT